MRYHPGGREENIGNWLAALLPYCMQRGSKRTGRPEGRTALPLLTVIRLKISKSPEWQAPLPVRNHNAVIRKP